MSGMMFLHSQLATIVGAYTLYTLDWEIFIVKIFSSLTLPTTHEIFSTVSTLIVKCKNSYLGMKNKHIIAVKILKSTVAMSDNGRAVF